MARIPFSRRFLDPRRANNFLDSCAFDPKYAPEHESAQRIHAISRTERISIILAHSVQKEIDHPNTPAEVKAEAAAMIFTIPTSLTNGERKRHANIHAILTGNGKPEKYLADATHLFEAGKYGGGYFITTDQRILDRRDDLRGASGAVIVTPAIWLKIYEDSASEC